MGSLKTPPRLGLRVPLPPAPREHSHSEETSGLVAGDLLEGRYQIEDRLGEGGVGFVYRARQIKLHRRVAVKLLQNDTVGEEALKPRFEREALTLAALSHPNIVSLNDYGMVRGQPFLVMELLEGRTLREILDQEGALDPSRALNFTRQMLLAAAYAHGLGIVHRDFKPANLLVQSLPCYEHLKVLDFGLVKLIPGSYLDSGVQLSRVGFTFGTPSYMSPEHASGAEVDGRADLYAVGVLLFEMLTGKKPFEGELQDVLRHHFQTPVPALTSLRPELAEYPYLAQIVNTAMAKDRADRYPDAAAMLAVVDSALFRLRAPHAGALAQNPAASAAEPAHARRALSAEAQRVGGEVVRKARVLSGRAWILAKPKLRYAATSLLSLAAEARARLVSSARRLQAPRAALLELPAEAPADVVMVGKTLVERRSADELAEADADSAASDAATPGDDEKTVVVASVPPDAPE